MALGKYSRVDGKKSSSYCSTVTVVVFVAVCLVGVWMMTSSSVVPINSDVATQENKSEGKMQSSESISETKNDVNNNGNGNNAISEGSPNDESKSKKFEDNAGDLTDDATKKDTSLSSNQEEKHEKPEETEKTDEERQEEKSEEEKKDIGEDKKEDGDEKKEDGEEKKDSGEDKKEDGDEKKEDGEEKKKDGSENEVGKKGDGEAPAEDKGSEAGDTENKSDNTEKKSEESSGDTKDGQVDEKVDEKKVPDSQQSSGEKKGQSSDEVFPSAAQSELLNETKTQNGAFSTQAAESKNEKEAQKSLVTQNGLSWKLCNTTAGADYIPCLDNFDVIKHLRTTKHYEHRERHCPEEPPTCFVPLPEGYQRSVEWPTSREKIWYHNVPHTKLAEVKGHQNWVKVSGEYLTFPGGGTQFKHGALHYIDFIQQSVPDIAWGKRSRVVLDVGCGVASFGGYLFDRETLTMSLAPKDEHEAQVQFALERGIPAISAVMGTKRLPYPSRVFDVVHCARCRVPWHIEGGKLLLELNRLLRPGGYFVWSATPVYQKLDDDVEIWEAMKKLTKAICWELVSITKDSINGVGIAIYQKATSNECYEQRPENDPPLCEASDDPNAAWNVPLQACIHKVPASSERGSQWPEKWPARLQKSPYWLLSSQVGVYGKPAPEDFAADYEHWKNVVNKSYLTGLGIKWSTVRNVMDMRAVYGGLAAALKELNVWVMNIISVDAPDTLPIIYERGLFGMYHDWCESFSTYPRSYDLLHADHLFSKVKKKCNFMGFVAEVDRILRPEGKLIIRDNVEMLNELEGILKSMNWEIRSTYSKDKEGLLFAQKTMWRPKEVETLPYSIA